MRLPTAGRWAQCTLTLAALLGGELALGADSPPRKSYFESADGKIKSAVQVYRDCKSEQAVGKTVERDVCLEDSPQAPRPGHPKLYLMGHNPGIFKPLLKAKVGDVFNYWDAVGTKFVIEVTGWRDVKGDGKEPLKPLLTVSGETFAQLQFCIQHDTQTRVIDAKLISYEVVDAAK